MNDRILAERTGRGWSQAELARQAGVTRQLVGAIEAGRHAPGVTAALALARALETSVEQLFGAAGGQESRDVLGRTAPPGTTVGAGRVGERLVTTPLTFGADGSDGWAAADAVVTDAGLEWLPGSSAAGLVLTGCDPVLDLAADLLARSGRRVLAVHASTGRSVEALGAGLVHGVLVHARPGDLPEPPVPVRRWHVARWQVGLTAPAGAVPSIDELASRRPDVVQRDAGAGAQKALVRALRAAGADVDLPGPVGHGHVDVARRVAHGGGAAGVVMEPAAHSLGLGFVALEEHTVELWFAEEWTGLPAAQAFVELLGSPALARRSTLLPGYDPTDCGTELRTA
ncbi:hypothetical protein ASD11_09910 [Aeromicrobium sp. Root495]|uniref:substrate-binding domain-containing protein n=1 Tax=Aeromicrobium sp. Root495 TaxID=1736550 RepID=UPI0006FD20F0|nr:substrate-binding domain-containing protein [Aeromicrobium sp. Root495]KQY59831.1 hypothetical protein ASD11_09910 [Aeromicrobium sp. Root495]